jgi:molybdate transport system permease protein
MEYKASQSDKYSTKFVYRNIKRRNILFKVMLYFFIITLLTLIIAALSNILIRGYAGLQASITSPEIIFSLKLSLFTSLISTALCILFAVPIAYGLVKVKFPGKIFVSTVLNLPLSLPPVVSGVALLMLFGGTGFGKALAHLGIKFVFDVKGIILAQFFVNISYILRIVRSTFEDINPRLEFVSRTLGCTEMQSFFKVTLPLAKNGLIAGTVITWARAIGEFGAALMLVGATRMKTETLPVSLFLNMSTGDLKLAMASASIIITVSVVSLLIFEIIGLKNKKISKIC